VANVKWEKMSEYTAKKLEALIEPFVCQKKPMFGYDVYWVNGNMFTGVFQSSIFFRLSPQDQKEFLGKYKDSRRFEPMEGRLMKEYVVVPEPVLEDKDAVGEWMKRSFEYTKSLPEKKAKSKKVQK
jgi:TfoX/Sxy family transcriptional regulator of competence genes